MEAKKYFESIRNHVKRARELESRAEELRKYADNISGMRYDRPEVGKQKNGAVHIDAMYESYLRLERTADAAYNAAEVAASLVAEASEILTKMLSDVRCDVDAVSIIWDYYIDGKSDDLIANERFMSASGVCRARLRGLKKSQSWLDRAGVVA